MPITRFVFFLLVCCSLIACDPAQETDFRIVNNSSSGMTVTKFATDFSGNQTEQTSTIAKGYNIFVLEYYDFPSCGANKSGHFSELPTAFDSIVIVNEAGRLAEGFLFDESNWSYEPKYKNNECSAVLEIVLSDDDFL